MLEEIITDHGAVVFNGDGYSEDWQIEAEARGLLEPAHHARRRSRSSSPPEALELFSHYGVFNDREMHSRYEIALEQYALSVGVEARSTLEMATTVGPAGRPALPDRAGHQRRRLKAVGIEADTLDPRGGLGRDRRPARPAIAALRAELAAEDEGDVARARPRSPARCCSRPWPRSAAPADALEAMVADDLWPLPTYQEMLFIL